MQYTYLYCEFYTVCVSLLRTQTYHIVDLNNTSVGILAHTNCNADSYSTYVHIVDSYSLSVCIMDYCNTYVSIVASDICLYRRFIEHIGLY